VLSQKHHGGKAQWNCSAYSHQEAEERRKKNRRRRRNRRWKKKRRRERERERERERVRERESGDKIYPSKPCPLVTYFLQLQPASSVHSALN
jgi:hypothetical protein